jgi:hypothetical protein
VSALPRPDLAPGPQKSLNDALHDLHHRAGWPSLRTLARDTGVSHTTVSKVMSAPALPSWGTLELLVEAMDGDAAAFHDLWLAASTPTNGAPAPAPRIAGRHAELEAVRRHLETGTGLLLVTGEAGMGKTRLVTAAAEAVDTFVAAGHCLPLSTEVPFLPIASALRHVLDRDDGSWLQAALDACPTYVRANVARLLPELDPSAPPLAPDDSTARQRLFVSMAEALRSLTATGELCLLVEDLHWADPGTLDLVEHLLASTTPPRLAGTWRLDDAATPTAHLEWYERIRRSPKVRQVELSPLSEAETAQQLALLGVDLRDDLARRVYRRTRGQPLFTDQLAAQLDEDAPLPRLLSDLLDRRFDGLTDAAWHLTRALGVADRPLTADQLEQLTGLSREHLVDQLHDLQRRRLVRTTRSGAAELQHPLLAEATRRRLVAGEARAVHGAVAGVLGLSSDASPAEVAGHWEAAAEPEHELEWRVAAARAAAEAHATAIEAEQWLRAMEIWPSSGVTVGAPPLTREQGYLATMDAVKNSMQFDRAARMSDEAAERLGEVDPLTRAELLRRAADFAGQRVGPDRGLTLIEESLTLFDTQAPSTGLAYALLRKAALLQASERFAEAAATSRAAADAAARVGDAPVHRTALSWVAWYQGASGCVDEAMRTMAEATALVPPMSDPAGDIRQALILTDVMLLTGAGAGAIEDAGRPGLAAADRWQIDSLHALLLRSNLVWSRVREGRVADAAVLLDAWPDEPVDIDRWPLHLYRACLDSLRGHDDVAVQRAESLWRAWGPRGVSNDLEILDALARVHLWSGAPEDVLALLLPALEETVETAPAGLSRPALVLAAQAAADAGDAVARRHRTTIRELHSRLPVTDGVHVPVPHGLAPAYAHALDVTWVAELARLEARDRVDQWSRAIGAWDALGRPHDTAYARWRTARCALREGRATLAATLLTKAATGAREHVPLSRAIAATRAGAR